MISTGKRVLRMLHPFASQIPNRKGEGRFHFYVPQVSFGHGMALCSDAI